MKKRILCIVMAGLSLISLTACANNNEDISNESNTSETAIAPTDEVTSNDGYKHIANLEGKTYKEIISEGYSYSGYMGIDNNYEFTLTPDAIPEGVDAYLPALAQMTIGDLLDKDLSIGYMTDYDTECTFDVYTGSFYITFEVEGGLEILKKYENDDFFDVENAPELHDKKVLNPQIESMEFTIKFKDDVSALITDDFDDSVLNDLVVSEFYYTPIESAFM